MDLGATTEQSNMAAEEPMDELKECLRASVEMLLENLNDRLHEDMDGVDNLCVQLDRIQNLVERASGLYDIPLEIVDILRSAQDSLRSLATGKKESWVFKLSWKTVFSYSPRSPLFLRTVHEIVARRVERRHDELKGNTTS